ncbi:hypothetical protein EYF80_029758 [Liparis tanakae]|uniref:Uncharacterized protein n=1 Tax=Liparis tanakae TaxID=230148 RepID=A0A4Z2H3E5_9TELE|nr:hypothetical protein EYF80_029758 [Liparis tanakae]
MYDADAVNENQQLTQPSWRMERSGGSEVGGGADPLSQETSRNSSPRVPQHNGLLEAFVILELPTLHFCAMDGSNSQPRTRRLIRRRATVLVNVGETERIGAVVT